MRQPAGTLGGAGSMRLRVLVAVAGLALALGGCVGRGGLADVTGSLGASQPRGEQQWRAELPRLQQAYDSAPDNRTAALNYARALRAIGQNQQAVAVLQNIVVRYPGDHEVLGAFGRALMDTGQLKQADDVLARAHLPERPDWRILSAQGAVADQLGDHARAQGFYQSALRLNPGEPTVLSNLGLSYALAKRLPEAEQALTAAARHPGADKRVRQNLMLVYGLQGRFSEAEQIARSDLPPEEAAKAMQQLRQMTTQANSWDAIRRSERPRGAPRPAGAPAARAGASQG